MSTPVQARLSAISIEERGDEEWPLSGDSPRTFRVGPTYVVKIEIETLGQSRAGLLCQALRQWFHDQGIGEP